MVETEQARAGGIQVGDQTDDDRDGNGNQDERQPEAALERQAAAKECDHGHGENQKPDGSGDAVLQSRDALFFQIDGLVE